MKLFQIMKHYHRIEFISSVKFAMEQTNISEHEMFNRIYDIARTMKINTGFSRVKTNAWEQYRKFVQYHKTFFSSKESKQDIDL